MRHKNSNLYGNWFVSSGERSASSKRVYKNYATTSALRREMEDAATKRIAEDIYFRTLPRALRKIARDCGKDEIRREIENLVITEYGNKVILYDPISHAEERIPRQSIQLCTGIYIAPEGSRKGMPAWEYLKWYILWDEESNNDIADAIEEWSGIPTYLHRATYNALINYLRTQVQKEHDNEDRYNSGEIRIKLFLGF